MKKYTSIGIDKKLYERLEELANREKRSISQMIEILCEKALQK